MTAGYPGTPLGKKLGYRKAMRVFVDGMPDLIRHFIPEPELAAAHIFVTSRAKLEDKVQALMTLLAKDGFIWVSWPKKASKVPTDITEDTIREVCLPMGLVDVKVWAVDATWSGLKLMRRRV